MTNLLDALRGRRSPNRPEMRPPVDPAAAADPAPRPGPQLPPGDPASLDDLEKHDRTAIARRSAELGPIFTGMSLGETCVCIVGLQLGRRFLQENADALRPLTLELEPLIPKGFLRQMRGDDHRDYRRALVRASRSLDPIVDQAALDAIVSAGLRDLSALHDEDPFGPSPLLDAASAIATAVLIALFFGVAPGSARFENLKADYRTLGPFGLVWNLKEPQHVAFASLRDGLRGALQAYRNGDASMVDACVLAQLADAGDVDDTMLGNLVYMVEMGRQDIQTFFRWLIRYAAMNPAAMRAIAREQVEPNPSGVLSAAEAFVLEVLRCHQSERLMRRVTRDIVFDGYLIPDNAYVRICSWEAHHDSDVFADPDRFDAARFLHVSPTNDQFAPFGIDNHQCPFGGLSIRIGTTLLRALAAYETTLIEDGRPVRGAYHWEPSRKLNVRVEPR